METNKKMETTNEKFETMNYELFKFHPLNRDFRQSIFNRKLKSIKEIGYLKSRPVIVDENMVIIDGRHTFEVCKFLKIPVVYEIEKNIDAVTAMLALNINQTVWSINDYVGSHAKKGIECYKEIIKFEQEYKLGITNSILICKGSCGGNSCKLIRKGNEFAINPNRHEIANFILECKPFFSFYKEKAFVYAVVILYKKTTQKNIEKVFNKIQSLRQQATAAHYLSVFENIINRRKGNDDKITLL